MSDKLLDEVMRFFTSLCYVQNDNALAIEEGGLVVAKPPPSHILLSLMHCHSERNIVK